MKDNEKNLSNEAAESVAGGFRWPWQPKKWSKEQAHFLRSFMLDYCTFKDEKEFKKAYKEFVSGDFNKVVQAAKEEMSPELFDIFRNGLGI